MNPQQVIVCYFSIHLHYTPYIPENSEVPRVQDVDEFVALLLSKQEQSEDRLARIEVSLQQLIDQRTRKDWYSTDELAERLNKSAFTVMEWCRLGRIHAAKKGSGRGKFQSWVVSHDELLRYEREGLLPIHPGRNIG